ncbi:hypothetical protein SS1G_13351 [Sclerotinia sclerotiorum 1980 UF-70]|uniref:Ubiquitin-like domain-containing protein n=2 Tax=Sclerotinia sclerotiorum (strain ATCC 18683 / 1980 / Ss-1) TaxID=665079 RepID=A7F6X1_SCLS1|nr:hypothetical protein SS1G_13351 [Sclerotinia sclerotiorum 1980 UF-70]APA08404.1 hypothetical protein sscle_03g031740 [Sclerotinia sclerotiorum 1980 UF-70]EDN98492.1 hypothetical protein SS1G_13351 [Sclerotinia sclerotiorum 1980 UF-70]
MQAIKFKDAISGKYILRFHLVSTWAGMEERLKQAFLHDDALGPHVNEGHYDLVGPEDEITLPQVWEFVVEPVGMSEKNKRGTSCGVKIGGSAELIEELGWVRALGTIFGVKPGIQVK